MQRIKGTDQSFNKLLWWNLRLRFPGSILILCPKVRNELTPHRGGNGGKLSNSNCKYIVYARNLIFCRLLQTIPFTHKCVSVIHSKEGSYFLRKQEKHLEKYFTVEIKQLYSERKWSLWRGTNCLRSTYTGQLSQQQCWYTFMGPRLMPFNL